MPRRGTLYGGRQTVGRTADAGPPDAAPPLGGPPEVPSPDSAPLGWLGRHLSGVPASRPGAPRADTVPRIETVRITAPDLARRAALRKTRRRLALSACRLRPAVPDRGRQADDGDGDRPAPAAPGTAGGAAARCATDVAAADLRRVRSSRHDRRSQRPAAGHLAALGRAVRRPPPDHRSGGRDQPPQARAAAHRRRRGAAPPVRHPPADLPSSSGRSPRARSWRSTGWAFPGWISAPPRCGAIRWAASPRRCWAASMWTTTASPGWRSRSTRRLSDRPQASAPVARRARAGGGARRVVQGDGRVSGDRRLRHRHGRQHGRGAGHGQPARLRRQRVRHQHRRPTVQPRDQRALRAGQHVQAADRRRWRWMAAIVHIWDEFDASRPIHIGRFTITDFEGKHRWLYLPEVLAYSSNIGAAHIADGCRRRAPARLAQGHGHVRTLAHRTAGRGRAAYQPASNWKEIATMTVGFGHGIAVDAAAGGARHRRGGQRRHPGPPDHPGACRPTPSPRACG